MSFYYRGGKMKRVFVRGNAVACSNYDAALRASGMEPVFSMDLALADCCDGLLLTGGYDVDPAYYGQANTASVNIDPIRDKEEIALVRRFMELERPIFGICRENRSILSLPSAKTSPLSNSLRIISANPRNLRKQ